MLMAFPCSYAEEAGDPYQQEIEDCTSLLCRPLTQFSHPGLPESGGPVKWLQPHRMRLKSQAQGVEDLLLFRSALSLNNTSKHCKKLILEYRGEIAEHSGHSQSCCVLSLSTAIHYLLRRWQICARCSLLALKLSQVMKQWQSKCTLKSCWAVGFKCCQLRCGMPSRYGWLYCVAG